MPDNKDEPRDTPKYTTLSVGEHDLITRALKELLRIHNSAFEMANQLLGVNPRIAVFTEAEFRIVTIHRLIRLAEAGEIAVRPSAYELAKDGDFQLPGESPNF